MNFDAVISPAGCLPAIPHQLSGELPFLNAHFMLYNILDFPAGVLPVKLVSSEEIKVAVGQYHGQERMSGRDERPRDRIEEFMALAQMDS